MSTITEVASLLQNERSILADGIDAHGEAIIENDLLPGIPASNEDIIIAPWLAPDEPPTPPPKPQRSFGFPHKPSFSGFTLPRQSSGTLSISSLRSRPSESYSTLSIPESEGRSTTYSAFDTASHTTLPILPPHELRKSKSSKNMFSDILKKTRSKTRLRAESEAKGSDRDSFSSDAAKKEKRAGKRKVSNAPPPLPPKEPDFVLDTNLDKMDGIVDLTIIGGNQEVSSPGSYQSSSLTDTSYSLVNPTSESGSISSSSQLPDFTNPWPSSSLSGKQRAPHAERRPIRLRDIPPDATLDGWSPPESWVVEDGKDPVDADYPSSDDGAGPGTVVADRHVSMNATYHTGNSRRRTLKQMAKGSSGYDKNASYKIRIYRENNSFHIVSIGLGVTVGSLTPALNSKLLNDQDLETHRLYLMERGRERILAQTERPADIVRRRLEQAGYDAADGLDFLGGDDLTFLLKFVYKSQLVGPAEKDLTFDNFEFIDLTRHSLQTIPVALHTHADSIVSLKLSQNPMLQIPLDFIQSCTTLRELRLSNMAMKKVPNSVRHSRTLHRIDLSCNRIIDIDAGLHDIPELATLNVQNNRMEKLPWTLPRFFSLSTLNISNNKFTIFPSVVCRINTLCDLDISFNMISELPDEIGNLQSLQRLVVVGNKISRFPDQCSHLVSLHYLDCRRNHISDLAVVCMLPELERLSSDHNAVHALDLSLGPRLVTLDASHNEITQLSLIPGPVGRSPYALTSLDVSYAKLSSFDDLALGQLTSLQSLNLNHNSFKFIPDSLGQLSYLRTLSCSDNLLDALPETIGNLQKLETLDVHNNSLIDLPISLWNCASLSKINVTSNLLVNWHDPPPLFAAIPPPAPTVGAFPSSVTSARPLPSIPDRKESTGSIGGLPPLAYSLEKLYVGENQLTNDSIHPLALLRELRILNLSFNEIQEMPPTFFKNLAKLEELYLSGNKLSSIPMEDLPKLTKLSVIFLNGNRLKSLPQELGKVQSLTALDVGSNVLKYNISNWEFDWNWNFNKNLRYLNLSGNKHLQIKSDTTSRVRVNEFGERISQDLPSISRQSLSGFTSLSQLRILGLMDVTITMNSNVDIPDESEDRRVRTSLSTVNNMAYGIADSLGRNDNLNIFDLVHEFREPRKGEAVFGMFGRVEPSKELPAATGTNRLAKYLHDNFLGVFVNQLDTLRPDRNEGVPDALRRSFLKLNKDLHDTLYSIKEHRKNSQASMTNKGQAISYDLSTVHNGATSVVLYFVGKTMYVANVGNALAVISRQGSAQILSKKHDPFDRVETARIRAAEGWVSPPGLVNDEVDVSKSFGFYHLLPIINSRPHICKYELSELDEFVIVGNRGLWDYVNFQTAVDIARSERADPMIAAQKLRDFAISYGAEGNTMIMVIAVADLFNIESRSRQPTIDLGMEPQIPWRRPRNEITDRNISRLDREVPPPTGHLALVFTDIRNSTHLWEVNAGMNTAIRLHNNLLRRQLRLCGGYEVKTEGDAFMCSFPTTLSALWWALSVQVLLLQEAWPLEILECGDGREIRDEKGRIIARGLSVRMGIHSGVPLCEIDPVTHRMDYFGPMVNRSARINGSAAGGEIMCSVEVVREINAKIRETEPDTELSEHQPFQAIEAIRVLDPKVIPKGEYKLKGLEVPETLWAVYPGELEGRQYLEDLPPALSPPSLIPNTPLDPAVPRVSSPHRVATDATTSSRVPFSVVQTKQLGMLCLRLEALSTCRVFRPLPPGNTNRDEEAGEVHPSILYGNPDLLLPQIDENTTDMELMQVLDSLSIRIDNAASRIAQVFSQQPRNRTIMAALQRQGFDEQTLRQVLAVLDM